LYTFLLCLAWSALEVAGQTFLWSPSLNNVLSLQINGFAVMLAVLVADRASPPASRRWWPYVVAVVVGVALGTTVFWLVSQRLFLIPTAWQLRGVPEGFDAIVFRHSTSRLLIGSLATYIYVSQRWGAHRLAALRAVQLERAQIEKRVLESRLAAVQARVEPQFLRDTLAQVERLYEIDAQAADRMLKEFTTYLRAAIPQIRDPASTVAREVRLTNAYLNIVGMQSKDRLLLTDGPSTGDARMPPMLMLPLIQHALARRTERARGDELFAIDLAARNGKLMLTIRDRGSGFAPEGTSDQTIRDIRERLATLYGGHAQLTLKPAAGGSEAVIEIPVEVVSGAVHA
jgi:sensor histidine kinase YesM